MRKDQHRPRADPATGGTSLHPTQPETKAPLEGLTTIASSFGPKETIDRLEAEIRAKGLNVFARIDHAAGAAEAGLELRPTTVVIFGNARGGGIVQAIGPLKVLAGSDPTSTASQRFLIVTDIKNSSQVVLRQTKSSQESPAINGVNEQR
jgi:hypothetical protein